MVKRIRIPDELKEKSGVITKGMSDTLILFSTDEWKKFQIRLESQDKENRTTRRIIRFFVAYAQAFDAEDTYVDLSEDLQKHFNGSGAIDGYNVTYGEGPFDTYCWIYTGREWMLDDLITRTLENYSLETISALQTYLDRMKTADDLEELKCSISGYDLPELYCALYYTFKDMLTSDEYEKYRCNYHRIFDYVEDLFPEK